MTAAGSERIFVFWFGGALSAGLKPGSPVLKDGAST